MFLVKHVQSVWWEMWLIALPPRAQEYRNRRAVEALYIDKLREGGAQTLSTNSFRNGILVNGSKPMDFTSLTLPNVKPKLHLCHS